MTRIRAALCRSFGAPLVIETVEIRPPLGTEVEVSLEACAICHSDISFAEGAWSGALPAIYGHEACGIVTAAGEAVRGIAVGERVLVTLIRSCGQCRECASGRPVLCGVPAGASPLTDAHGVPVAQGMKCGAFAEKVVVEARQTAPLDADIGAAAASLLACGVITGIGAAVNTVQVRPGQTVVVIGAGGVGLNVIQGARLAGAARIVAVDMNPGKLKGAMVFGATDTVLASLPQPWADAAKAMGRGADCVFVATGALAAYQAAPRYLGPGGKLVIVGMPHLGQRAEYEPVMIAALAQGFQGSLMGDTVLTRDIPWLVDLYRQGRLKLDELVSRTWSLDKINEAMADTKAGGARRNVILFGGTG